MEVCRSRRASCERRAKRTSKPACIYDNRRRLESCSRDPIGYLGSPWSLYEYVESAPLSLTDPDGMKPRSIEGIRRDYMKCKQDCTAKTDRRLKILERRYWDDAADCCENDATDECYNRARKKYVRRYLIEVKYEQNCFKKCLDKAKKELNPPPSGPWV